MIKDKSPIFAVVWTYGKDLYPSAIGKPNNRRTCGSYPTAWQALHAFELIH